MEHLLFLAHRIPYPPTKGDKVRSYHLLRHLAARYRVHLGAFVDDAADFAHADAIRKLCVACHLLPLEPSVARIKSLAGFLSGLPLTLRYFWNSSMQEWVTETLRTAPISTAVIFSSSMAQYVIDADGLRRVVDLVDVDSDKWWQYAATQPWPYSAVYRRESRTLLKYERELAQRFDATVLVSAAEADLFKRLAPASAHKVHSVNNGVDCDFFSPDREYLNPYASGERVVVFTGAMDYWPNVDAVVWFARNIFPEIRREIPEARFYIVGARPRAEVSELARVSDVRVTGTVPDVRPYLAHAEVSVAPLRMARGVQNKVLEAMAMAIPVLASPQAAEGIEAEQGTELLIAGDEGDYVRKATQLLRFESDSSVGAAGRARVLASYDWQNSLSRFDRLLKGTSDVPVDSRVGLNPATASRSLS